jgi:hypothetical protein
MRKIVLLIIDDDGSGDTFYSLAKEVWRYNLRGRDIPYYFLNATQRDLPSGQIWVDSDTILTRYHENFNQRVTEKTYLGIKHCHENMAFDFLLRTNLSSFYNLPPLIEYLDALEAHNIYAGKITTQYYQDDHGRQQSFSFCSGSGFLLSRDVCEKVIQRHQMVDKNLIDDVWIRLVLQDIPMLDMPRCDLIKMGRYCSNTLDFAEQQILRSVEEGVFHFRVKDCFDDLPRSVGDAIALEMLRKSFC